MKRMIRTAALLTSAVALGCLSACRFRSDVVYPLKPVEGVQVSAVRGDGQVGWTLTVANKTGDTIRIIWDESGYVDGTGRSLGRLIRESTSRANKDREQLPTIVTTGATHREWCVPELQWGGENIPARDSGRGELRVVLRSERATATWVGEVIYDDSKPSEEGVVQQWKPSASAP